jgi:hypothetical protein
MKSILLLLIAMIGAACGTHLGARIQGIVTSEEPCAAAVEEALYEECVEDIAVSMGIVLSRRLELRGNRDLQTTGSTCGTCCSKCADCNCYPKGTWCWTKCGNNRRLTVTEDQAHAARFLIAVGQIQKAANDCLDRKIQEGYTCLGDPSDLMIKIYLTE